MLKPGNKLKITGSSEVRKIPRVLFVTSGVDEGAGYISEGVLVAVQTFSMHGNFVWLDNRDVLMKPKILSEYSVMILPTSMGYNDGDRKYSLTFLSDYEMENIKEWVKGGGILIAEENIGRNHIDGKDRVDARGELNSGNWKLSELFGIEMKEIDLNGFSIEETPDNVNKIWNGIVKEKITEDEWVLIPSEVISDKVKTFAEWKNDDEKYPAILVNDYGKGKAYLLTSTYILHPSNAGGYSSIEQIEKFYNFVLNPDNIRKESGYEINPWPDGHSSAFCLSFNPEGNSDQFNRVINFVNNKNIPATFFIDSELNTEQLNILKENKNIKLQSGFYSNTDLSYANYSQIVMELNMNEQHFDRDFNGLKFPFGKPNFWGLIYADEKEYVYESSISVDHLSGFEGSVFPYNIPVSQNSYYKTLDMLEISPAGNKDENYFGKSLTEKDYIDEDQRTDGQLFNKYLFDFYEFAVQKYNGLMVYAGSPQYTGFSENTILPLINLTDSLITKNCWITSLDEVADFRNKLKVLSVEVSEIGNEVNFKINLPKDIEIRGFTFKLNSKPESINSGSRHILKEINGIYYLTCDVKDADSIDLIF